MDARAVLPLQGDEVTAGVENYDGQRQIVTVVRESQCFRNNGPSGRQVHCVALLMIDGRSQLYRVGQRRSLPNATDAL